ncbi:MAG: hypothetical protein WA776_12790 [Xanthobacteraceae bacterium]
MLARQIAIGFGIAVIFPLLVYYGVASIYPPPEMQYVASAIIVPGPNATPEERQKYQDEQRQWQKEQHERSETYKAAAKDFARHLIIVAAPLGVAAILIGAYLPLYAIGTGLIFGGIFAAGSGYWSYWGYLENWVRFASLLAGFLILLFVGYYRVAGSNTRAGAP